MALVAIGFEGSANKLGVGIVRSDGKILANLRHTFITPPGTGFLPRETALHHNEHLYELTEAALKEAGIKPHDLSCVCFTKGNHITLQYIILYYLFSFN